MNDPNFNIKLCGNTLSSSSLMVLSLFHHRLGSVFIVSMLFRKSKRYAS
jgi:hypothetical protein